MQHPGETKVRDTAQSATTAVDLGVRYFPVKGEADLEATLAHRLPTIFSNRTYLRAGGLMSYGPDLEGVFQRAAYFVDRILKGAKPTDLPIEQAATFQLVLNQRTARALGRRFPQSLLIGADEVIE